MAITYIKSCLGHRPQFSGTSQDGQKLMDHHGSHPLGFGNCRRDMEKHAVFSHFSPSPGICLSNFPVAHAHLEHRQPATSAHAAAWQKKQKQNVHGAIQSISRDTGHSGWSSVYCRQIFRFKYIYIYILIYIYIYINIYIYSPPFWGR